MAADCKDWVSRRHSGFTGSRGPAGVLLPRSRLESSGVLINITPLQGKVPAVQQTISSIAKDMWQIKPI